MTQPAQTTSTWYDDGMQFTCTQCGNCCTGPAGYVWFNDQEADEMAQAVDMKKAEFLEAYSHVEFGNRTLKEICNEKGEYDCVFLKKDKEGKRGCSIYAVRPQQCRTWPFWPENLKSPEHWRRGAVRCPGMTAGGLQGQGQGKFYPIEEIRVIRDSNV
ncbi:MAG: YkgJ family cysteine cluster protein [Phycisphaeraceae bacterium]|nr:YkgJ family cysteine cluster protein [Phycisphaeraceae bacterium]